MTTGVFHSRVVGVSHANEDGRSRQKYIAAFCKRGMPLILKREPENPHDPNAIGVWIKARVLFVFTDVVQIGYLDARTAGELTRHLDRSGKVSAVITDVTGGLAGKRTRGVTIQITKHPVS